MRYLGLDVHTKATVWHLLDGEGQTVETGKTATTGKALTALVRRLAEQDELLVGQEVGKMTYLVHDVLTAAKRPGAGVQRLAPPDGRRFAEEDRPAGRLLAGEDPANGDDAAPGVRPDRRDPRAARTALATRRAGHRAEAVALASFAR